MSALAEMAKLLAPDFQPFAGSNMNGVAKLMVLVAEDMAMVNQTGRTREMIVADAQVVLRAVFGGVQI